MEAIEHLEKSDDADDDAAAEKSLSDDLTLHS